MDNIVRNLQQCYDEGGEEALHSAVHPGFRPLQLDHAQVSAHLRNAEGPKLLRATWQFAAALVTRDNSQRAHFLRLALYTFQESIAKEHKSRSIAKKRQADALAVFDLMESALRGNYHAEMELDSLPKSYVDRGSVYGSSSTVRYMDYGDSQEKYREHEKNQMEDGDIDWTVDAYLDPDTKKRRKITHNHNEARSSVKSAMDTATAHAEESKRLMLAVMQDITTELKPNNEV